MCVFAFTNSNGDSLVDRWASLHCDFNPIELNSMASNLPLRVHPPQDLNLACVGQDSAEVAGAIDATDSLQVSEAILSKLVPLEVSQCNSMATDRQLACLAAWNDVKAAAGGVLALVHNDHTVVGEGLPHHRHWGPDGQNFLEGHNHRGLSGPVAIEDTARLQKLLLNSLKHLLAARDEAEALPAPPWEGMGGRPQQVLIDGRRGLDERGLRVLEGAHKGVGAAFLPPVLGRHGNTGSI
mmetsp:Transcript_77418/g.160869  ORF Transcript_77418/g.160869 Transcript_77418/m.160869 type:complete len:239 (+) Transcript_77418:1430-2146(+)